MEEKTSGAWRPSPGAIYPALAQLEDEGLIEPVEVDGRKAFALTPLGREHVEAAGDRPRPWDFASAEEGDPRAASAMEVWQALAQVGTAAHALLQTGDEHLARAGAEILGETRRSLYRLLADERGPEGDVQDDVPRR